MDIKQDCDGLGVACVGKVSRASKKFFSLTRDFGREDDESKKNMSSSPPEGVSKRMWSMES